MWKLGHVARGLSAHAQFIQCLVFVSARLRVKAFRSVCSNVFSVLLNDCFQYGACSGKRTSYHRSLTESPSTARRSSDRGPEPMTEVIREAVRGVISEMFPTLGGTVPVVSGSPPFTGEC